MRYNGSSWQKVVVSPPVGSTGSELMEVAATTTGGPVWAGGNYHIGNIKRPQLVRWNGSTWIRETVPAACDSGSIQALRAFSPTDVWASGSLYGRTRDSIWMLHFNGTIWTAQALLPAGTTSGEIWDIDGSPNDLWAVGNRVGAGNPALIMHYDGNSWSQVPVPTNQVSQANTAFHVRVLGPGQVMVAVDAFPAPSKWLLYDGSSWTTIAYTPNSFYAAALGINELYCWNTSGIQKFNGTNWSTVQSIAQPGYPNLGGYTVLGDGTLWMVGNSVLTNQVSRTLVYRYAIPQTVEGLRSSDNGLTLYPNPVRNKLTVETDFDNDGTERLVVLDVAGRVVQKSLSYVKASSNQLVCDLQGLPVGSYILKLETRKAVLFRRFSRI
jgi:hypothetical protein